VQGALLYRKPLPGIRKEYYLKAILQYRLAREPARISSTDASQIVLTNFSVLNVGAGAEFLIGGWNHYWDLDASTKIVFPILHEAGAVLGSGSPAFYLPSFSAEFLLRRRFSQNWRAFIGTNFGVDMLKVSETRELANSSGGDTKQSWLWIGPRFGVECDL
jgi:hypothetical protein